MKEGARFQAAIQILDNILASQNPADSIITAYFRQSRYMGSNDRRVISEMVYQILRRIEELKWYLQSIPLKDTGIGRLLILAYAYKILNFSVTQIEDLSHKSKQDNKFGIEPLNSIEYLLLKEMDNLNPQEMPLPVRLNIPEWLLPHLQITFGDQLTEAMQALNQPAPFDLRVNSLKANRETVLSTLMTEGFQAMPTPWSPLGIRMGERRPLSGHPLWKNGDIEVQDEGSQLLALLTDAKPGMAIIDYCAGAGGKTLAMAATMQNRGRIIATDVAEWRLKRARERLRRAGANNVEFRTLDESTHKWLKRQAARFDRVLVDAPCSGSGTWRRNPDIKRRFSEKDFLDLVEKQQQILLRAAPLVKPGGRLIYATCSLFCEENDNQISKFLNLNSQFHLIPVPTIWETVLGSTCPSQGEMLHLTPHQHQVDGFFMAIMERNE
jgi:16S rRNA (cytosine967-C5)-methyltransferase